MKDDRIRLVGRDEPALIALPEGTLIKWERFKTWNDPTKGTMFGYAVRFTDRPLEPEHREFTEGPETDLSFMIVATEEEPAFYYRFVTYSFELPASKLPIELTSPSVLLAMVRNAAP